MARVRGITQFYLPPTRLSTNGMNHPLLCKHSLDGATRARLRTSDYSSLLIYRPRKDERLSWPRNISVKGDYLTADLKNLTNCQSNYNYLYLSYDYVYD